jgi:hypothetical protein
MKESITKLTEVQASKRKEFENKIGLQVLEMKQAVDKIKEKKLKNKIAA